MNYKEFKEQQGVGILETIQEIIETENLTFRNRQHHVAHKRYFLMNYLRKNTLFTWEKIGNVFERDHATVINAIKRHDEFMEFNDSVYQGNTETIKRYLKEVYPDLD